jgi:hypothetical protein
VGSLGSVTQIKQKTHMIAGKKENVLNNKKFGP